MYRGKNQEQYIAQKYRKTYLYALRGSRPPCILKGFSLGIHAFKKRGMVFFWGKDMEKFAFLIGEECIGGRTYRGKNV